MAHLLLHDGVGLAQERQALLGDVAQHADGQARPRERLPPDDLVRQAEERAQLADLVLEELAQRLDQLEAHVRGQAAHVVVGLDRGRRTLERHRLDDVRVERPLGQPRDVTELAGFVLEHRDELGPDRLPLDLGIRDTFQLIDESLTCIDMDQVHLEGVAEGPDDPVDLALPQEAVVHEEARELIAHRPVDQGRHHRGVHAARQRAEHGVLADLAPDAVDRRVHERRHGPVGRRPRRVEKVLEHRLALRGVSDLGVELHREDPPGRVGHGRDRAVVGGGQAREARRGREHGVAVAHPHRHEPVGLRLHAGQQPLAAEEAQVRLAVLPHRCRHHVATHQVAHGLHAVADPEQRDPGLEEALVGQRSVLLVDARRPAGEHDGGVAAGEHALDGLGARQDLGVDAQLADAAGDQLRVLAPEIEDRDPAGHRGSTAASPASGRAGRPCPRS